MPDLNPVYEEPVATQAAAVIWLRGPELLLPCRPIYRGAVSAVWGGNGTCHVCRNYD